MKIDGDISGISMGILMEDCWVYKWRINEIDGRLMGLLMEDQWNMNERLINGNSNDMLLGYCKN